VLLRHNEFPKISKVKKKVQVRSDSVNVATLEGRCRKKLFLDDIEEAVSTEPNGLMPLTLQCSRDPDAVVAVLVSGLRGMNVAEGQIDRKLLRVVAPDGYGQLEQRVRTSRSLAGYRSAAGLTLMHQAILSDALKQCGR
jgi:hypothetical protein